MDSCLQSVKRSREYLFPYPWELRRREDLDLPLTRYHSAASIRLRSLVQVISTRVLTPKQAVSIVGSRGPFREGSAGADVAVDAAMAIYSRVPNSYSYVRELMDLLDDRKKVDLCRRLSISYV
ncbi:hypothetical protein CYMTET_16343 [Cymbomonas tetramitiformis]|uniref:Uncharacterized protein n=1 Tax=Cymbomonas tetramitiformis TaxID=36881 RepID=A0AAE0GCJ0_9CHLO|nr:hypothetical protein CYMTET_16343 [Cymbomonas tetramitiformis]